MEYLGKLLEKKVELIMKLFKKIINILLNNFWENSKIF